MTVTEHSTITVTPLSPTIGAQLDSIDLRDDLGNDEIDAIRRALLRWKVLFFRDGESVELLQILCRQAAVPEYQVRFHWEQYSIAFWDNRACQHYAVSDYWPNVRKVERVTIIGDAPYYDPAQAPADTTQSPFRGAVHRYANS